MVINLLSYLLLLMIALCNSNLELVEVVIVVGVVIGIRSRVIMNEQH
jgi:hypothetical protein